MPLKVYSKNKFGTIDVTKYSWAELESIEDMPSEPNYWDINDVTKYL